MTCETASATCESWSPGSMRKSLYLATKADLEEKPGKTYMWGIMATLLTAYACGLAALAILK